MAEKPMVGARIPHEWKTQLEEIAQKSGRNASQVVYEAIAAYLGKDSANTLANQVKVLAERVAALEQQQQGIRLLMFGGSDGSRNL